MFFRVLFLLSPAFSLQLWAPYHGRSLVAVRLGSGGLGPLVGRLRAGAVSSPEEKPKKKLRSFKELKGAVKQLVTLYGPIAIIFDFVTLMAIGWSLFFLLQTGVVKPPQFIYDKVVGSGPPMAKGALNFAISVAICESVLVPFRAIWALYWTPKIAKCLPDKWKPKPKAT